MTVMFSTPAGRQTGRSGVDRIAMEYRRRYGVNPSPDVVNRMIQGLDAARYEIPETPQSILDMPLGGERNQAIHAFKQPHFDKRTQLREGVTLESLGIGAPSSNFFDQATTGSVNPPPFNPAGPGHFNERQNNPYTRRGGLGGLLSRFDPRRMGGGFGGMFGRRRPPPFFGGGQFGGRRPFPGMYRGMPTFMDRMRPPFFDRRQKRPFFGLNRRPPFGGGFRPPFFQQSRPSYNPIPDIDDDAFRQFRQRIGQRPPTAGEASAYQKNNNLLRQMDGTIFGQSNAPQIPQELIDAQLSSVQQGPPIAGGTGSLYGTPASQEEINRMQTRMGGLGSIGGMMTAGLEPVKTPAFQRGRGAFGAGRSRR